MISRGFPSRLFLLALPQTLLIGYCTQIKPYIYKGEEVLPGTPKYNYIVQLVADSSTVCNGIAIDDQWILTAAHCAYKAEEAIPFGAEEPYQLFKPGFYHPAYSDNINTKNDLALLKTKDKMSVWWQEGIAEPNEDDLIVFGWGTTDTSGDASTSLRRSKPMHLQDRQKCNCFWEEEEQLIDDMEFCVGDPGSSACNGDSGGPLFNTTTVKSKLEPQSLAGILSKADDNCDEKGIYDVYTKIDIAWIKKTISENSP